MKTYVLKDANQFPASKDFFLTGLVFGFDVGTGSIGYAVRQGSDFKDVGVLICDSEGSDLSKRVVTGENYLPPGGAKKIRRTNAE